MGLKSIDLWCNKNLGYIAGSTPRLAVKAHAIEEWCLCCFPFAGFTTYSKLPFVIGIIKETYAISA
jgi:hypothetical protein